VLAGHPGATSGIGLPGLSRIIRVTEVKGSESPIRLRGEIEDRSQLRRGESSYVELVVDTSEPAERRGHASPGGSAPTRSGGIAIGDAEIVGDGGHGWPGGHYLAYKLLSGPHAGRFVYVAEAIEPLVSAGQHVKAGDHIARFGPDAAPGHSPGIETGWSSETLNLTWAKKTTGYHEGDKTPAGKAFCRFLHSLGVPQRDDPGAGPEFPA
jgi:hypothetical protein